MLAELMRLKYGIAVAGTPRQDEDHVHDRRGPRGGRLDPTIVVGGRITSLGSNARLGQGEYLVAEADESDGSFLKLAPTIAVVTTVDAEHLDHYGTLDAIREAFVTFVNKVPFYGAAVLCLDQPNIQLLIPRIQKRIITYGLESGADLVARRLHLSGLTSRFEVFQRGTSLGECTLQVPGRHNVLNALAAISVAVDLEIPFLTIQKALAGFAGVQRRFQVCGKRQQSPSSTTTATIRRDPRDVGRRQGRLRPPRGGDLSAPPLHAHAAPAGGILTAFNQADALVVMDIYGAGRGAPLPASARRTSPTPFTATAPRRDVPAQ